MVTVTSVEYQCTHCGEWNVIDFDPSGGLDQRLVEDCSVCCYPLVVHLQCDPDADIVRVDVEVEA